MSLISRLIVQRMLLNSKWGVGVGRGAATNRQWTDRQLENTPFLSGVLGNYPVNAIILRNETLSTDNEMFVQKRLSRCRPVIGWRGVRLGCRLIPRVVRWYVNRPSTLFHELEKQTSTVGPGSLCLANIFFGRASFREIGHAVVFLSNTRSGFLFLLSFLFLAFNKHTHACTPLKSVRRERKLLYLRL